MVQSHVPRLPHASNTSEKRGRRGVARILETLQCVLDQGASTSIQESTIDEASNSVLKLEIEPNKTFVKVASSFSRPFVVEAIQQIIWMGTALRLSKAAEIEYSNFSIHSNGDGSSDICLDIRFHSSALSQGARKCWVPLFANPVIANDFPIDRREDGAQGLEIPLEMMAALGGARHITEYEGGLVLRGHSAIFVPTQCYERFIQWHFVQKSPSATPYSEIENHCPSRAPLSLVDFASLKGKRTFLGWWDLAESHLGTADADYGDIDWSPTVESNRSLDSPA